jgi:cytochrome c biogenesis protein CcmG/thiol:disulfide interchange protein DsbE
MSTATSWSCRTVVTLSFALAVAISALARADDEKQAADKSSGKKGAVEALAKEGYWGKEDTWKDHSKLLNKPMPRLELSGWVNSEVKAADMKGKIVVVDYWATWCGPCIASIPHNNKVAREYADKGVLVIGACGGGGEEKMEATAKQHGIEYPAAKVSKESTEAWGVQWWPTYVVVDRKGNIRAIGIKPDYVEQVVDALLKEQPVEAKTAAAN